MTGKRIQLDLGQIAMPVGEHRGQEHGGRIADGDDVARLQAILRRAPVHERPRAPHQAVDLPAPAEAAALLSPGETAALSDAGAGAGSEAGVAALGEELESLWISNGASGRRTVRLKLREAVLPHTTVRLFEAEGRLMIDMRVACETTRCWLAASLPGLGAGLGERLLRPLRLVLAGVAPASMESTRFDWPEDSMEIRLDTLAWPGNFTVGGPESEG